MPNFVLQYDMHLANIRAPPNASYHQAVYAFIKAYLEQQGFQNYQHSCWRIDGAGGPAAFHMLVLNFANAVDHRFGPNAFRHVHYEQRLNFVVVR
jgi:virulence-associated protein VapD